MVWLESRRRTCQAAKCSGEAHGALDPEISEWDFLIHSVRRGHPGNRNILVPGGKEINRDAVSKGDRKRQRANRILPEMARRCGVRTSSNASFIDSNKLGSLAIEGDSPVEEDKKATRGSILSTMRRYSRGNMGGMNIQP